LKFDQFKVLVEEMEKADATERWRQEVKNKKQQTNMNNKHANKHE